jgi:acyl-CoA reductase-like NAD-dependent aldehyde dehydrogenase
MGPVVSPSQRESVVGFVDRALEGGATQATPTESAATPEHGCFLAPVVLSDVDPSMEIWTEEVFGPVVALVAFDTLGEALDLLNASQYGLAAAIYTSDLSASHHFAARADVGQVAVNLPTSGWDVHMPFGGFKSSGSGHKEQGLEGLAFYRQTKTVAMDTQSGKRHT